MCVCGGVRVCVFLVSVYARRYICLPTNNYKPSGTQIFSRVLSGLNVCEKGIYPHT